MNRFGVPKTWLLLGGILVAAVGYFSLPEPPENPLEGSHIEAENSSQTSPASPAPDTDAQVATDPTEIKIVPREAPLPEPSAQPTTSGVDTLPEEPVYIGHTDRVALQPEIIQALRQRIDTSHTGLHVKTQPNGTTIVDTRHKFHHVAVAAITPDGKIVQQDFSTAP